MTVLDATVDPADVTNVIVKLERGHADAFVNDHSPMLTCLLTGNNDVRLLIAADQSAQGYYVAKYSSKSQLEVSSAPLSLLLRQFAKRKGLETAASDGRTPFQRAAGHAASMLHALVSDRQVGSTLACLQLQRGGDISYCSHQFRYAPYPSGCTPPRPWCTAGARISL